MEINRRTKPQDIVDCVRVQFTERIDYQVALRVRNALSQDSLFEHRSSFEQLPAYIRALQQSNPTVYTHLHTHENRFLRVFICPYPSRSSFPFCRKFIALDGTFLKGRFIQTMLLATTLDANHNILLLAWAVVESENTESWRYFLQHLFAAIPEILTQQPPTTIISDRDKGLNTAVSCYEPNIIPALCCFHLRENFTTKFGRGLTGVFWRIARAVDQYTYHLELQQLRGYNHAAADYLCEIPSTLWVAAYFPGKRYGQDTSNIVERINATFKLEREYAVIDLLNAVWHKTMTTRYDRQHQISKHKPAFTEFAIKELNNRQPDARLHRIELGSVSEGRVTEGRQLRIQHFVDLLRGTCTCRIYQELGIPCEHALGCILQLGQNPQHYLPMDLSTETWKNTYSDNLHPVVFTLKDEPASELPEIQAPLTRVPRGRPRKERIRKGAKGTKGTPAIQSNQHPQTCSTCHQPGHNARTCKVPHT